MVVVAAAVLAAAVTKKIAGRSNDLPVFYFDGCAMTNFSLSRFTRVKTHGDVVYLGFGSSHVEVSRRFITPLCDALGLLIDGTTECEFFDQLTQRHGQIVTQHIYDVLMAGRHISRASGELSSSRYSRTDLFLELLGGDSDSGAQMQDHHVTVIGCGGIGNLVSMGLAGLGIRTLTLIDDDVIEESNLSRQFAFAEDDVGLNKVDVLRRELLRRNRNVEVDTKKKRLNSIDDVKQAVDPSTNLVLLSADKPDGLIYWVNEFCVENKISYVNAGYVEDWVCTGPFYIPDKTACIACGDVIAGIHNVSDEHASIFQRVNRRYQVPSSPSTNTISAGMVLSDIILFLAEIQDPISANGRRFYLPSHFALNELHLQRNPKCAVCG